MGAEADAAKAAQALARQVSGLDKAASAAGDAAGRAGGAVGQARQAGFDRVAEGLGNLKGRIEKVAAMLSTASGQVGPGLQAASEVTGQSTPQQAITRLTACVGAVEAAHATISGAVQEVRAVENQTGELLQGAQPGPLLARLAAVREAATDAGKLGLAAKRHAQSGIAHGQQIAGGSGAAASTTQLVRAEGPLRYETGEPKDDSERFGELVRTEESDQVSRRERQEREWVRAIGEGGQNAADALNRLHSATLPPSPSPTGSHVGTGSEPAYQAPPREGFAGDLALGLAVLGLVLVRAVQELWDVVRTMIGQSREKD